jgi:hypothetical protein
MVVQTPFAGQSDWAGQHAAAVGCFRAAGDLRYWTMGMRRMYGAMWQQGRQPGGRPGTLFRDSGYRPDATPAEVPRAGLDTLCSCRSALQRWHSLVTVALGGDIRAVRLGGSPLRLSFPRRLASLINSSSASGPRTSFPVALASRLCRPRSHLALAGKTGRRATSFLRDVVAFPLNSPRAFWLGDFFVSSGSLFRPAWRVCPPWDNERQDVNAAMLG